MLKKTMWRLGTGENSNLSGASTSVSLFTKPQNLFSPTNQPPKKQQEEKSYTEEKVVEFIETRIRELEAKDKGTGKKNTSNF